MEMKDLVAVYLILSIVVPIDTLLLAFYLFHRFSGQRSTQERYSCPSWQKVRRRIAYGFSILNFVNVICLTIYFRKLDLWLWDSCSAKMPTQENCIKAASKWNNVLWCFVPPGLISYLLIFTSVRRARLILLGNLPGLLYSPGPHGASCALFQLSLILTAPLAYPDIVFKHATGQTWVMASMACAVLAISVYLFGIALWAEGMVYVWYQSHLPNRVVADIGHDESDMELGRS